MRNPNPKLFKMNWLKPYRHLIVKTPLPLQKAIERLSGRVVSPSKVPFNLKRNWIGEISSEGFEIHRRNYAVATGKFISQQNGTAIDIEIKPDTQTLVVIGIVLVFFAGAALFSKSLIDSIGNMLFDIGVYMLFMVSYSAEATEVEEFINEIFDPKNVA